VIGKGFNPSEYISMEYDNGAMVALTTSPLMPKTNSKGSFTCTFVIPTDAVSAVDNIYAEDETGAYDTADLEIGPYITVTPKKGLVDSTVTVAGRGFTPNGLVDIEWLIGGSYITVVNNAAIGATGSFSVSFTVPLLPDPTPAGDDYSIRATDNAPTPIVAATTFTLVELASIKLTPPAGKIASSLQVEGTWFTPMSAITVSFDGEEVATETAGITGAFTVTFAVPEVATGPYTVTATDSWGVSASATFTVVVDVFMVATRATEYVRMDFISLVSQATVAVDVDLVITDPTGLVFYDDDVDASWWQRIGPFWHIPYVELYLTWWPITSDAPLGTWNFTCYDDATGAILDTNLFTVAAKPTMQDVLDKLDGVEANITDIITTTKGDIIALINTKSGQIVADISALNGKITSIDGDLVTISTRIGDVQVAISALDLDAMGVSIASIEDDVATITTDLGTVKTSVSALNVTVTALSGDVATVSTSLGTLEGTVTSIDGKVATINTNVGTVQADVSDIKAKADVDMTPVWIAVVLSLVAAIAAIFAVVTIRQKIAG